MATPSSCCSWAGSCSPKPPNIGALHRRIAQATVAWIGGTSGRRIVLAIMLATTLISMWISNAATALMMLPVAMAFVERDTSGKLAVPLLLGVAYALEHRRNRHAHRHGAERRLHDQL